MKSYNCEPNPKRLCKRRHRTNGPLFWGQVQEWFPGVASVEQALGRKSAREHMNDLRHSWRSTWVLPAALPVFQLLVLQMHAYGVNGISEIIWVSSFSMRGGGLLDHLNEFI